MTRFEELNKTTKAVFNENKSAVSSYLKERKVLKAFKEYHTESESNISFTEFEARILWMKPNVLAKYYDILIEQGKAVMFNTLVNR